MPKRKPPVGTVGLLFVDIEGSTQLARVTGPAWNVVLEEYHRIVGACVEEHDGWIEAIEGDGVFATFAQPRQAGLAALAAQQLLERDTRLLEAAPIRARMGVHVGYVERIRTGYAGLEIHRAARVTDAAHGGQVFLTATAMAVMGDGVPAESLGLHRLKDFPAPEELFAALIQGRRAADFPPPRTLELRSTNLPPDQSTVVGRGDELAEVIEALRSDGRRLVTLTGRGGCGKTRLARFAGSELLDSFAGGVWWVPLASLSDPDRVLSAIAESVQADRSGRLPVLDALVARFGTVPTLLILDNLEQLVGVATVVAALLDRTPHLQVLATSQVELGLADEYRVRLGELSEAAAVDLFEDRGRFAHPGLDLTGEDRRVLALAARRLDYLPLAIELAAARLSVLTPVQLDQRLVASTGLVRGRSKDPLARHGSLRDTIAWSASLLDEGARRTFLAMTMFARPATLEAVEATATDSNTLDALAALIDFGLVRRVELGDGVVRFELPQAILEYAATEAEQSPHVDLWRLQHAQYAEDVAFAARTDFLCTHRELAEAIHMTEDVRHAWRWASQHNKPLAARLAALEALILIISGREQAAGPYLDYLQASRSLQPVIAGWLKVSEARQAFDHGQDDAARLFDECLTLINDTDPPMLIWVLTLRARLRSYADDDRGAIDDCVRAGALARHLGSAAWASCLEEEAAIRAMAGQFDQSNRLLEHVDALCRNAPDSPAARRKDRIAGGVALSAGRSTEALGHYERALIIDAADQSDVGVFLALGNIAFSLASAGHSVEALEAHALAEGQAIQLYGTAARLESGAEYMQQVRAVVEPAHARDIRERGLNVPAAERANRALHLIRTVQAGATNTP